MLDAKTALGVFQIHAETGNLVGLRNSLRSYSNALTGSADGELLKELTRFTQIADLMTEMEENHGAGSAMNLEHPIVVWMMSEGLVEEEHITAARNYAKHRSVRSGA